MASTDVASGKVAKDKYRSFLHDEAENIQWRHGAPPTYGDVNKLFEEGRTKVHQHALLYISFFIHVSLYKFYGIGHFNLHICRNGQKDH